MKYTIELDHSGEGGSAEFYLIKEDKNLGFKQFRNKKFANKAYEKQKLLSKYHLAPKVIGSVCKMTYKLPMHETLPGKFYSFQTNWGYITEKAKILDEKVMKKRLKDIQNLVETIENKTHLRFWDCHYWNVGYIKRRNKAKLVCIDTGPESFDRDANAWGFGKPGPKCDYCNKYQCRCSNAYWFD
jgi:hypothetical protein